MLASAGGTPEFIVDDESFEASAKKPLVEAQLQIGMIRVVLSCFMTTSVFVNLYKLRVSSVDLRIVHYHLAQLEWVCSSSPNLWYYNYKAILWETREMLHAVQICKNIQVHHDERKFVWFLNGLFLIVICLVLLASLGCIISHLRLESMPFLQMRYCYRDLVRPVRRWGRRRWRRKAGWHGKLLEGRDQKWSDMKETTINTKPGFHWMMCWDNHTMSRVGFLQCLENLISSPTWLCVSSFSRIAII